MHADRAAYGLWLLVLLALAAAYALVFHVARNIAFAPDLLAQAQTQTRPKDPARG